MQKVKWNRWSGQDSLHSREYICGYCGCKVGAHTGYTNGADSGFVIYLCTNCGYPTLFIYSEQHPGPILGRTIKSLPDEVSSVYDEIRNSIKNGLYTATLLLGRKLIMHLAVNIAGAKEGETFAKYVEHLKTSGYIPPNGDQILKFIKDLGNEKNHELKIGTSDEATKLLKFIDGLLIFIYEFPGEFPAPESK